MSKETETRPRPASDESATTQLAPTADASEAITGDAPHARITARDVPPREVGRFRIEAQLGSGGMGDVFRAYDPVLDRAVALKVLHTDAGADGAQRMRRVVREARAAAALTHPNTVTIFEVGEAGSEVFIAMELLEGEDLRAVLERGNASLDDKLRWLLQAARALVAAHERGLVHRDVKPENMFVCKDGTLKLLDFGIAKRDEDDAGASTAPYSVGPSSMRTQAGRRLGTPRYMAPEQRAGEPTDARTDEYAWGLVAFELLTGTDGLGAIETVTKDGSDDAARLAPARLEELRAKIPELPESTVVAIAQTLEPRKEDRFASMASLVAALEAAPPPSGAVPVEAVPVSAPRGAGRGSRRLWLLGAALVLLSGAAIGMVRRSPTRALETASSHQVTRALPPSCRVVSTHDVAATIDDRVAVLPDGTIVVAHDVLHGIRLERETPAGMVPMPKMGPTSMFGDALKHVELGGTTYNGAPAITLLIDQGQNNGGVLATLTEGHGMDMFRLAAPLWDATMISHGDTMIAVASAFAPPITDDGQGETTAYLITSDHAQRHHAIVEKSVAVSPSIAASTNHVGVAYKTFAAGMHYALLDQDLARVGDVLHVSPLSETPAAAFAGETAVVYWTQDHGGKTRLTVSSLTPGELAFSPPAIAIDEALAAVAPLTIRLPNGEYVVAWIASAGGPSTLRVSTVGARGALVGPTDVGTAAAIRVVRASTTEKGIAVWWNQDPRTMRVAHVTCGGS